MALTPVNPNGLIFVWDLDQTLVSDKALNTKALEWMNKLFNSDKFIANLMLTNNSDGEYINRVHVRLIDKYNEMFPVEEGKGNSVEKRTTLFNNIYTAEHDENGYTTPRALDETVPVRQRTPNHLAKRLVDVENMLKDLGLSVSSLDASLAEHVYFFDDLPNHILRSELPRGHYIHITPPFSTDENDTTDYSSVQFALDRFTIRINHSGGAYTKTRKRREEGQRKRREEGQGKRREEGQGKRQGKRNTRTHKQKKTRGRTR